MKVSYHCLASSNLNENFRKNHSKVMNHFGIDMNYDTRILHHGIWMDQVMESSKSDIVFFMDCDCIPLNREIIDLSVQMCENGYLVGNAQVSNHLKAKHMYFCAPSFMAISREYYEKIGKPSAINNHFSDVAQEFTREANKREMRTKMFFPDSFQEVPNGGIWRMAGYGYYGIGTIFHNSIYHLFQSSVGKNEHLFSNACDLVVCGRSSEIQRKHDSKAEHRGLLPIENEHGDF